MFFLFSSPTNTPLPFVHKIETDLRPKVNTVYMALVDTTVRNFSTLPPKGSVASYSDEAYAFGSLVEPLSPSLA